MRSFIESIPGGYQQTTLRFTVSGGGDTSNTDDDIESVPTPTEHWVAFAVPWAPHKSDGGVTIIDSNLSPFNKIYHDGQPQHLTADDLTIWKRLRDLKNVEDIQLALVQDLIGWYLDDTSVITTRVKSGVEYQVFYEHKIAADSCLFLPTRLPVFIAAKNPTMDYSMWVKGGMTMTIPKYLKRLDETDGVELFRFKNWDWDEDTRINTDNWESSDDELLSDSDEE